MKTHKRIPKIKKAEYTDGKIVVIFDNEAIYCIRHPFNNLDQIHPIWWTFRNRKQFGLSLLKTIR